MRTLELFIAFVVATSFSLAAVTASNDGLLVPLWPNAAPGSEDKTAAEKVRVTPQGDHVVSSVHQPSLTVFLPAAGRATGAGVIVCPGGGHRELWMDHEGYNIARWLADHGIAAFILKYRLAREEGSSYKIDVHALADAQRALRVVFHRATEWGVDPARVGIMGFSAGGEVAALASQRTAAGDPASADAIERLSVRPAFQALVYPGNSKSIAPVADSPPAFLLCGYDDRPDISEGLAQVYLRFKQAGVAAELHIFTGAGHGFGMREKNTGPVAAWPTRLHEWLAERGFLRAAPPPASP